MSLLNDMLKDLDKNQSSGASPPPADSQAKTRRLQLKSLVLPLLAGLLVVYWLLVEMNLLGLIPQQGAQPEIPEPMAANADWLARMETLKKQKEESKAGVSEPVQDLSSELVAESAELSQLLDLADRAFADGRLIQPLHESALPLYMAALALEPDNLKAREGIRRVQSSMLSRIDSHIALANYDTAKEQAELAKSVFIEEPFLKSIENKLTEIEKVYRSKTKARVPNMADVKDTRSVPPSLTEKQKDRKLAKNIQAQGVYAVEAKALAWINASSENSRTVIALADEYRRYQAAEGLVRLGNLLKKNNSPLVSYVQANSALLHNDMETARRLLEDHRYQGAADIARQRLLAGMYQSQKNFEKALPLYEFLVNSSQANVNDWLGFAVVSDAKKKPTAALTGFQRVIQLGHPDPKVMQYAESRIQKLSRGG